jgi:hypothetical protein
VAVPLPACWPGFEFIYLLVLYVCSELICSENEQISDPSARTKIKNEVRQESEDTDAVLIVEVGNREKLEEVDSFVTDADESGIVMISHRAARVCPITRKPFDTPVKNPICRHKYEASALKDLLRLNLAKGKSVLRCPVAGCDKNVELNIFED